MEMDSEGVTYKATIRELNYLDDDFSDGVDHFAMALERQLINSGKISDYIRNMEGVLRYSQLFVYGSYVNKE